MPFDFSTLSQPTSPADSGIPQQPDTSSLPIPASDRLKMFMSAAQPQVQAPQQDDHPIKNYLSNWLYQIGEASKAQAGLPTDFERQQADYKNQLESAQTKQVQQQTQMQGSMVTLPNGIQVPFAVAQKVFPEFVKGQFGNEKQTIANTGKTDVAKINQGIQVPVPNDIAAKYGLPAGGTIPDKTLSRLQGLEGKNLQTTTQSVNGQPHKVIVNKATGETVHDLGLDPILAVNAAKARSFADAKASVTPFQTFDENGNLTTISNGQAIANGVPSANTWNTLYGATGSTKSQGQAAGAVAEHIPAFQQSVHALAAKGELGPVMGRLNTYLTSGYGGSDPDVAEFVTTVGLLKSGAVRAHFGARGGANILSKFDGMLNTAQTPEALIGSTNAINNFLQTYKQTGSNANTPKTNITTPSSTPSNDAVGDYLSKFGKKK